MNVFTRQRGSEIQEEEEDANRCFLIQHKTMCGVALLHIKHTTEYCPFQRHSLAPGYTLGCRYLIEPLGVLLPKKL